jgi:hypothetical protein
MLFYLSKNSIRKQLNALQILKIQLTEYCIALQQNSHTLNLKHVCITAPKKLRKKKPRISLSKKM